MASRSSKEKMAAAFHRLFHKSDKLNKSAGGGSAGTGVTGNGTIQKAGNGSPARRLLGRHGYRDTVKPAESLDGVVATVSSGGLLAKKKATGGGSSSTVAGHESTSQSQQVRAKRLMKELEDIRKGQPKDPVFTVELVDDNLFEWHVRLYRIDSESDLAHDMRELGVSCISLHLTFPEHFPFRPPFMRVISPRIEKGFVMEGGAICMELLTPHGWASAYTVEAVVMQFAASIVKGQGRIARKPKSGSKDFNQQMAEESFRRLVKTHEKYGWVTPPLADG